MILQALAAYYQSLAQRGEAPLPGYATVKISHALRIGWDGTLLGILPLSDTKKTGKKVTEVPKQMILPEPVVKASGVSSNFLFENAAYLLGLNLKGDADRTQQCFEAAQSRHQEILKDCNHKAAKAILSFFAAWNPAQAEKHSVVIPYLGALQAGGNLIFCLPDDSYAQDIPALQEAWNHYGKSQQSNVVMQCLVTGKPNQPIQRLHAKIKGVRGGQPTGTSIVSFNARSYESFGRTEEQGLNAPVSKNAAFAYTTALNILLSSEYCLQLGNTSVIYWAQTGESAYQNIFSSMLLPQESDEQRLKGIMERVGKALPLEDDLNMDTPFYVLGLSPNAGRLSIRFFWSSSFGRIIDNMASHYQRMEIQKPSFETRKYLSPYWLLRETVSSAATDPSASPLLEGALMRSIITGFPYPVMLAQSVITRIRAEHNITWKKAAILKSWLLNNGYQNTAYQEVLNVSLNRDSNNKPYILGRLFAQLEKAQEEANPGINATIKDRYFSSACAAPGTVFPLLLKLSLHHTAKAEYGKAITRQISELMDKLNLNDDPFPTHLSLADQSIFILGYYHEYQARFQKKSQSEEQ